MHNGVLHDKKIRLQYLFFLLPVIALGGNADNYHEKGQLNCVGNATYELQPPYTNTMGDYDPKSFTILNKKSKAKVAEIRNVPCSLAVVTTYFFRKYLLWVESDSGELVYNLLNVESGRNKELGKFQGVTISPDRRFLVFDCYPDLALYRISEEQFFPLEIRKRNLKQHCGAMDKMYEFGDWSKDSKTLTVDTVEAGTSTSELTFKTVIKIDDLLSKKSADKPTTKDLIKNHEEK